MRDKSLNVESDRPLKVLQLPQDYGGQSSLLKQKLEELGHSCELWTYSQNPFFNKPDRLIFSSSSSRFLRALSLLRASSYVFGDWDVVLYNAGSSLFSQRFRVGLKYSVGSTVKSLANLAIGWLQTLEIQILRARGVKLFMIYQGDDLRQFDKSLDLFQISIASQVGPEYYAPVSDEFKRRQALMFSSVCERTYLSNPDLFNFIEEEAEFLPVISRPLIASAPPKSGRNQQEPIKILHAPSHRGVKGTEYVVEAISNLSDRGFHIELKLVEGLSHIAALEHYRGADIVIDQLFAGWYGVFAVECMSLGIPVMAYIREGDLEFIPREMRDELPVIKTSSTSLEADLERLILGSDDYLTDLGRKSRAFVSKWHNSDSIACRVLRDFSN